MSNVGQVNPFFRPTQISGCQLWLDAADRLSLTFSSGTNVSAWADKSGGGYNVTQGTSTRQPTYNATNRQLLFTGDGVQNSAANQALQNTSLPVAGTAYTIFSVAKGNASQPSFTGYNYMIAPAVTFPQARLAFASLSGNFATFTGTGTTFNDTNANTPNISVRTTTRIWCMVVSGSTLTPFYDGISMNTKVGTTGSFTGLVVGDAFSTDSGQCWNGSMNEILFYNSALSTNQRQQIEGYLAWKWGLQANLPANHPYKSSPIPPLLSPPTGLPQTQANPFFAPTQISGCAIWYDAADPSSIATTGIAVTQWNDKSGNGRNATRTPSSATFYSKENKYVQIDGNSPLSITNANNLVVSTSFSIFMVEQRLQSTENVMIGAAGLSTNNNMLVSYTGATGLRFSFFANNLDGTVPTYSAGEPPRILSMSYFKPNRSISWNGSVLATDTNAADVLAWTSPTLGVNWFGAVYLGRMYEVIFYVPAVSQLAQRQQIEGYLAWKWGLQGNLPANHPYKSSPIPPLLSPPTTLPSGVPRSWQPSQISGLNAWFDGADPNGTGILPQQNTPVSIWVNKRNGGTNATAVGTGALYSSNGITFATPNYYTTSISYSTGYTIFLVATNTTNTPCYTIARNSIGGGRGPTFTQGYTNATRLQFYEGDGGVFPIIQDPTASPFITSVNYTSLGPIELYFNGINTSNTTSTATYNSAAWDTIGQAGAGVNTGYYNGTMKELIFYSNVLTTQQRQNIEGYLAWKWGLQASLPANHPFAKWPPSP